MSMIACFKRISTSDAERLLAAPFDADDFSQADLDLDKAWHAVHFSLTGRAWPDGTDLALAIFGGEPFGEDLGYGPPRLLNAVDVQRVAVALAEKDPPAVAKDVDISRLDHEDIYPGSWSDNEQASREYIAHHLGHLRDFYSQAASKGEAVLLWIT